ncbi:hypothetical protein WA158_003806 [Blastocystis sp. Blastoise]
MDYDEGATYVSGPQFTTHEEDNGTIEIKTAQERFMLFLKNFRDNGLYIYRERLTQLESKSSGAIEVDLADLKAFDSELLDSFEENPTHYLACFEKAASDTYKEFFHGETVFLPNIQVTYRSTQALTFIRDINASHVSKLVHVPGIVISASKTRAKATKIFIRCKSCNDTREIDGVLGFGNVRIPRTCDAIKPDQSTCELDPYIIDPDKCTYVNQQTIKLQECPEDVATGEMPRHILCSLDRTLVDTVAPGTRVSFIAVVDIFEQPKKPLVNTVAIRTSYLRVIGIHVETSGSGRTESLFTVEEEERFLRLARTSNIYELISKSIAPALTGDYTVDIKKALACLLFGGTPRVLEDNTRLRGDINILLMGDPSTAKSQFLKFIETVAPIGVYTSGKGSSAAGLTASVIQDSKGEFYLEGGAMVLADGGIVCIDEFDKMREDDRVAIHEAMEQQTISIAKAGITTVLNSRCSVLAAANPIYGSYDDTRSTNENIDFLPTILSRFDLIFIVRDIKDYSKDIQMAKHILNIHMKNNQEDGIDGEIPLQEMKRYIAFCRSKCHPVLNMEAADVLKNHYVSIRDEVHTRALQEGSVPSVPITIRQLEAIIRISESIAKMRLSNEVTTDDVNEAIRLFKLSTLQATKNGLVTDESLSPEVKKQVENVEQIIKSRIAIGAQIKRSRVINALKTLGFSTYSAERGLTALIRRREFEEKHQGRLLIRLR